MTSFLDTSSTDTSCTDAASADSAAATACSSALSAPTSVEPVPAPVAVELGQLCRYRSIVATNPDRWGVIVDPNTDDDLSPAHRVWTTDSDLPFGSPGHVVTVGAHRILGPVEEPTVEQLAAVPAALAYVLSHERATTVVQIQAHEARLDSLRHQTQRADAAQAELEAFKVRVRREALRVKREMGWCLAGTNESLSNLDLPEIEEGLVATVTVTQDVRIRVIRTDRRDRALTWAKQCLRITGVGSADDDVEVLDDDYSTEVTGDVDAFEFCDFDVAATSTG